MARSSQHVDLEPTLLGKRGTPQRNEHVRSVIRHTEYAKCALLSRYASRSRARAHASESHYMRLAASSEVHYPRHLQGPARFLGFLHRKKKKPQLSVAAQSSGAEWYEKVLGSPRWICAPMVRQSELAFRMLVRQHGVDLCYTPMIPAHKFYKGTQQERDSLLEIAPDGSDRPLVGQVAGNDLSTLVPVCKILEPHVDAIDLNLGCPKDCAERGHYGAFLLEEPDTVRTIVEGLVAALNVPVLCKIRLLNTTQDTVSFCQMLEVAGASLITVHCRHREGGREEVPDHTAMKDIKASLNIPLIVNGGIESYKDASRILNETVCDGIMVASGLLQNPRFFNTTSTAAEDPTQLAFEYLEFAEKFPPDNIRIIRDHMRHIFRDLLMGGTLEKGFGSGLQGISKDIWQLMDEDSSDSNMKNLRQFRELVRHIEARMKSMSYKRRARRKENVPIVHDIEALMKARKKKHWIRSQQDVSNHVFSLKEIRRLQ